MYILYTYIYIYSIINVGRSFWLGHFKSSSQAISVATPALAGLRSVKGCCDKDMLSRYRCMALDRFVSCTFIFLVMRMNLCLCMSLSCWQKTELKPSGGRWTSRWLKEMQRKAAGRPTGTCATYQQPYQPYQQLRDTLCSLSRIKDWRWIPPRGASWHLVKHARWPAGWRPRRVN